MCQEGLALPTVGAARSGDWICLTLPGLGVMVSSSEPRLDLGSDWGESWGDSCWGVQECPQQARSPPFLAHWCQGLAGQPYCPTICPQRSGPWGIPACRCIEPGQPGSTLTSTAIVVLVTSALPEFISCHHVQSHCLSLAWMSPQAQ